MKVWKRLWGGWGHPRARLMIWRIINHGYFTNAHGLKWRKCKDKCPAYEGNGESISHLFRDCVEVDLQWSTLEQMSWNKMLDFSLTNGLIVLLLKFISRQKRCPTLLLFIFKILQCTWVERNQVFQRKMCRLSIPHILKNVLSQITKLKVLATSNKKMEQLREAELSIQEMEKCFVNAMN